MRGARAVEFAEQRGEVFEEDAGEVGVFLVRADYVGGGGEGVGEGGRGRHGLLLSVIARDECIGRATMGASFVVARAEAAFT